MQSGCYTTNPVYVYIWRCAHRATDHLHGLPPPFLPRTLPECGLSEKFNQARYQLGAESAENANCNTSLQAHRHQLASLSPGHPLYPIASFSVSTTESFSALAVGSAQRRTLLQQRHINGLTFCACQEKSLTWAIKLSSISISN